MEMAISNLPGSVVRTLTDLTALDVARATDSMWGAVPITLIVHASRLA